MKNFSYYLVALVLLLNFSCKQAAEDSTASEPEAEMATVEPSISQERTQAVLQHHLEAFMANDLEAVLSDYTEESVMITTDSTYTGLEVLSGLFESVFPAFPTEGTSIEMDRMVIDGDLAFILWHADTPVFDIPIGTDTFIIVDGKILKQTFAATMNPKEQVE